MLRRRLWVGAETLAAPQPQSSNTAHHWNEPKDPAALELEVLLAGLEFPNAPEACVAHVVAAATATAAAADPPPRRLPLLLLLLLSARPPAAAVAPAAATAAAGDDDALPGPEGNVVDMALSRHVGAPVHIRFREVIRKRPDPHGLRQRRRRQ